MNKEDSSPSLRCVRDLKVEMFVEMFHVKLANLVWIRHIGGLPWLADKYGKHLELTLAI